MDAQAVIERVGLRPHPEGGWFRETWRADAPSGVRSAASAILYLLTDGERSRWHRVTDAREIWLFNAGGPLELRVVAPPGPVVVSILGLDPAVEHRPLAIVPAGAWQAARPLGAWTLVSCIVAPAFESSSFELAREGWEPGRLRPVYECGQRLIRPAYPRHLILLRGVENDWRTVRGGTIRTGIGLSSN